MIRRESKITVRDYLKMFFQRGILIGPSKKGDQLSYSYWSGILIYRILISRFDGIPNLSDTDCDGEPCRHYEKDEETAK
jgi:hypothetical protein